MAVSWRFWTTSVYDHPPSRPMGDRYLRYLMATIGVHVSFLRPAGLSLREGGGGRPVQGRRTVVVEGAGLSVDLNPTGLFFRRRPSGRPFHCPEQFLRRKSWAQI